MLENATDVVQGEIAQARILVAGEQRLAFLPQALMRVHTGAVVTEERFRHEGHGLVVALGDVFDNVLVQQHVVGHRHEVVEP